MAPNVADLFVVGSPSPSRGGRTAGSDFLFPLSGSCPLGLGGGGRSGGFDLMTAILLSDILKVVTALACFSPSAESVSSTTSEMLGRGEVLCRFKGRVSLRLLVLVGGGGFGPFDIFLGVGTGATLLSSECCGAKLVSECLLTAAARCTGLGKMAGFGFNCGFTFVLSSGVGEVSVGLLSSSSFASDSDWTFLLTGGGGRGMLGGGGML